MSTSLDLQEFKMPGFIPGVQETFKKGPVMAQLEVKEPTPDSFIFTRTMVSPKGPPAKDPTTKKASPDVLWPNLQATAKQGSLKPPPNILALGDQRIDVFRTSYSSDYKAPFVGHDRLRSPNRNEDLAMTTASLKDIYASAYNRVGEKRLQKIISTMRERLEAKMGNQNNNAFKFRKLFQMYDTDATGRVHYEDFRNMAEQFGMQLDDDSLLALYNIYDPEGTGYLAYHDLAKHLMDKDCYALYINDLDASAAKVEEDMVLHQLAALQKKFAPAADNLAKVLKAFDTKGTGYLTPHDLLAGCAGLGLILSEKELTSMAHYSVNTAAGAGSSGGAHSHESSGAILNEEGLVHWSNFLALLSSGPGALAKRTRSTRESVEVRRPAGLSVKASQTSPGMASALSPTSPAPKRAAH